MAEVPEYGEPGKGTTHIQWKGTAVCMDVYCACGELLHFDTWFAYHIGCSVCGQVYEVGTAVALRNVTREEALDDWDPEDNHTIKWSDGKNWWSP